MVTSNSIIMPQTPRLQFQMWSGDNDPDYTVKEIFTPGPNGSVIYGINVTTNELTNDYVAFSVSYNDGVWGAKLFTETLVKLAGAYRPAVQAIHNIRGCPIDEDGEPYLLLPSTMTLRAYVAGLTESPPRTLWVSVTGGDL